MSYTFPESTRWFSQHGESTLGLNIQYNCIVVCSYNNTPGIHEYRILLTNGEIYCVDTPRTPEFEAGFPEFPYNCCDYLIKTRDREEKMLKRIDMLEKTMMKLLPLIEEFLSDAEKRLDESSKK